MKILQINSVCGYGSTGRIAMDLYKLLEEQGHECIIAYGRGKAPEGVKTIKIGSDIDKYMHVAKTRLSDMHGFASRKATKEFVKQLEKYNPEVIHLHNIHGYYINIELLFDYLKKIDKPVIWTLHDCWAFTGHCAYFDYINCDKWKTECRKCEQKKEYPNSLVIDNSKSNHKRKKDIFTGVKNLTIVTPSNWLAKLVKESFLSEYKVKVINNGIDLDTFKPTKSDFREQNDLQSKFVILGVASVWEHRKGLDYIVELSRKLNEEYRVVVVGVTQKQKDELPEEVIGITRTNNVNELASIYTAADVFINPTLEDNFPTTNIEALACGTPIVTFNTGGSVEVVNEKCGKITKSKDVDSIINEIKKIKKYGNVINECMVKAKEYNKIDRYNEYIDLYLEVLK